MYNKSYKSTGFTIVELLIVIVVIAILAAISVVAYTGIQNRSYDSTIQSDLRNTYMGVQQFYILNSRLPNSWPEMNGTFTTTRSAYGGGNNFLLYCETDTDLFAVIARSKSGTGFAYSSNGGAIEFTAWPGDGNAGLCPAAGVPTTSPGYTPYWAGANGVWNGNYTAGQ